MPFIDWFERLIEPVPAVEGYVKRRRARYTALFLTILVPLGVLALLLTIATPQNDGTLDVETGALAAAVLLLITLFPLRRTTKYPLAGYATVALVCLIIWVEWVLTRDTASGQATLFFLVVPIFMASVLVGLFSSSVIAILNIIAASIAIFLTPQARVLSDTPATLPFFLFVMSGFIIESARIRESDLAEMERLASKLREQEATRLQLLNNIAHDLASPLTPIKLQVGMLRPDRPTSPESIAMLGRNLKQVERLVNDVRDLARLDAGQLKIVLSDVDLSALAQRAAEGFRAEADANHIRLTVEAGVPVLVRVDPERITEVTYNLVSNALKFTPAGGTVLVRVHATQDHASIEVHDTGRGLSKEQIGRLFRPFVQVHERTEVKERGTGLGLYISRGIARAHAGDLTVESAGPGLGSTFTLTVLRGIAQQALPK